MARRALGMMAGRAHGAEGIVGLAAEHRIDGRDGRAPAPRNAASSVPGDMNGVQIDLGIPSSGEASRIRLQIAVGMGADDVLIASKRRLLAVQALK